MYVILIVKIKYFFVAYIYIIIVELSWLYKLVANKKKEKKELLLKKNFEIRTSIV